MSRRRVRRAPSGTREPRSQPSADARSAAAEDELSPSVADDAASSARPGQVLGDRRSSVERSPRRPRPAGLDDEDPDERADERGDLAVHDRRRPRRRASGHERDATRTPRDRLTTSASPSCSGTSTIASQADRDRGDRRRASSTREHEPAIALPAISFARRTAPRRGSARNVGVIVAVPELGRDDQ